MFDSEKFIETVILPIILVSFVFIFYIGFIKPEYKRYIENQIMIEQSKKEKKEIEEIFKKFSDIQFSIESKEVPYFRPSLFLKGDKFDYEGIHFKNILINNFIDFSQFMNALNGKDIKYDIFISFKLSLDKDNLQKFLNKLESMIGHKFNEVQKKENNIVEITYNLIKVDPTSIYNQIDFPERKPEGKYIERFTFDINGHTYYLTRKGDSPDFYKDRDLSNFTFLKYGFFKVDN